jgi:cleavage and polyadenylation specificity factor subunit 2
VVQATEEATDSLLQSCAMIKAMTTEIYHPKVGEAIRIGEHMHNFTLALSDALMASVRMSSVRPSFHRLL